MMRASPVENILHQRLQSKRQEDLSPAIANRSSKVTELEPLLDCQVQSALDRKILLGYGDLQSP